MFNRNKFDVLIGNEGFGDMEIGVILNQNLDDVTKKLEAHNKSYRITSRDGQHFMVTMDYRPERYNLSVVNNIVVGVRMG